MKRDTRMPGRTPQSLGEIAYRAYWRAWPAVPLAWEALALRERRVWDQAAKAVIAAWQQQAFDAEPR